MSNSLYAFAGVPFGPHIQDWIPRPSRSVNYSLRHVPYSDINILDLGGRNPKTFETTVIVEEDDANAFINLLGVTASLKINGNTHPSCTLTELANHQMTPRDDGTRKHRFDAKWILDV